MKKTVFTKGHKINIGRACSPETKLKISLANKGKGRPHGYKHTEETKQKLRESKIGNKNHQWVNKSPSYTSVHKWLARNFDKLSECEFCGSDSFIEWSLKKGKTHDHNREFYYCLCSSCHKKYDYTEERKKKLSISLKKVVHTKEWGAKISASLKNRKLTEQHIQNIIYEKSKPPRSK